MSKSRELRELLLVIFANNADLELFIQDHYETLTRSVSFQRARANVANDVVMQLLAAGCVTRDLFDRLVQQVPGQEALIRAAQRDLGLADGPLVASSQTSPVTPPSAVLHPAAPAAGRWWRDTPIPWQEPGAQAVWLALSDAYPRKPELVALAENAGLREADINTDGSPREVARRILQLAASAALLPCLLDQALADSRIAAYHDRIRQAVHGKLRNEVAEARLWRGGEAEVGDSDWLANLGASIVSSPEALVSEGLQSIVKASQGLHDGMAFWTGITNAMRRTAMLETAGHPSGTGFLVGAKHLLTCAHVVRALNSPPPADLAITAVFDFYSQDRAAHAESGRRVTGRVVAWSYPAPSEIRGEVSDWNAAPDRLDYGLIELDEPAGDQPAGPLLGQATRRGPRGFFRLSDTAYDFARATLLFITQHPLGERVAISYATPVFEVNANKSRVRYRANTLQGSSGAPVIDDRGRLVALHHYAARGVNQGIPIHAVAADLKKRCQVPLWGSIQSTRPSA